MRKNWTEEDVSLMKQFYPTKGKAYCADLLGRTKETVGYKANELGLTINKDALYIILAKPRFDTALFKTNITRESAYLLGLLWADGSIIFSNNSSKTPVIKHSCVDYDTNCFVKVFDKIGGWKRFASKNKKATFYSGNSMVVNWVSQRDLGNYLIENSYRNKAQSPNKIIAIIPDALRHHFLGDFSMEMAV